jgi:hypothetical protein
MSVRDTFDMACPKCGRDDGLSVYMHTWAPLCEYGTDGNENEHMWDDKDDCACACGHHAPVEAFK